MSLRIERATNGYIIHARDPKIEAENRKPRTEYRDPSVDILCKTSTEVLSWLKKNLDKAMPASRSYDTAFAEAAVQDEDE